MRFSFTIQYLWIIVSKDLKFQILRRKNFEISQVHTIRFHNKGIRKSESVENDELKKNGNFLAHAKLFCEACQLKARRSKTLSFKLCCTKLIVQNPLNILTFIYMSFIIVFYFVFVYIIYAYLHLWLIIIVKTKFNTLF